MTTITHVDLVFENCESRRLFPHMFRGLVVQYITESYWINCFQYRKGEVDTYLSCKRFFIEILETGLRTKVDGETLKKRLLTWNDITHVHIYFDDGTDKYIGTPWRGNHSENELQVVKKEGKNLRIEIPECKEG